jgi:hypothetical protein
MSLKSANNEVVKKLNMVSKLKARAIKLEAMKPSVMKPKIMSSRASFKVEVLRSKP